MMFRDMRRSKQVLPDADTAAVLNRCTHGVLACLGDDEYPYAVPLSYVYHGDKIYFHSAKAGHKIDAICKNPKVSFTVIDDDTIVSAKFTSFFRSVIVFGKARIAEEAEWRDAFAALIEKYAGDQSQEAKQNELSVCTQSYIIAIDIQHMTGKEAIEYVNAKHSME